MIKISKKIITSIIATVVVVLVAGGAWVYHQATHFGANTAINGVNVSGLTAKAALQKLKSSTSSSRKVYLGKKLIYQTNSSKLQYSNSDLSKVKQILKKQFTLGFTSKQRTYSLTPKNAAGVQTQLMSAVKKQLLKLNKTRTKAQDAYAVWQNGKVSVVAAKKGTQYDVTKILRQLKQDTYDQNVYLTASIKQPVTASAKSVQAQKLALQKLAARTITYVVQNKQYKLTAKQIFTKVTYQNGKYHYDTTSLSKKIAQINSKQATLGKKISFTTHSGSTIKVKSKTYGWKISVKKAQKTLINALMNNKTTVSAKNDVYGTGYLTYGVGYSTTSNNGIGNTYAEVDISSQMVYIYKNGKCVLSVRTVTGKHSTGEDTPTGLYYIMYKQSPSTLSGSESGNSNYSVKVSYWAQFTNSGCGFHDATWRTNWSTSAYLTDGSGGCCNLHKSDAKKVYKLVYQGMPVIVHK